MSQILGNTPVEIAPASWSKQTGQTTQSASTYIGTAAQVAAKIRTLVKDSTLLSYSVEIIPGGHKLTFTRTGDPSVGGVTPTPNPSTETTIEIDWVTETYPLAAADYFATLNSLDLAAAEKSLADHTTFTAATELGQDYYDKRLKGIETFQIWSPVVRRTTSYAPGATTNIGSGTAGYIDRPPAGPTGKWIYLKTADRIVQRGRVIERQEEWTGKKEWDKDLYK